MIAPDRLRAALAASWPAVEQADIGGFRIGRSAAREIGLLDGTACALGPWDADDLAAAIARAGAWGQPAAFHVTDDQQSLRSTLEAQGFALRKDLQIMAAPVGALTDQPLPPVTAFALWPPLAIQRDLWSEALIPPDQQAVMARVGIPHAALLGRVRDRAAGVGFVAVDGPVAVVHALQTVPGLRRLGVAGWMLRQAGFWAAEQGAEQLVLMVERDNQPAIALARGLGFRDLSGLGLLARPGTGAAP